MRTYSKDPKWMDARFPGVCHKCKGEITPGQRIFYYPTTHTVYCNGPECGQAAAADFAACAFDEGGY